MAIRKCLSPICAFEFYTNDSRKNYCCRECQVWHNNERARERRLQFKSVDDALKRNYTILRSQIEDRSEIDVNVEALKLAGFDFFAFTGLAREKGSQVPVVYDLALLKLNSTDYRIKQLHGAN